MPILPAETSLFPPDLLSESLPSFPDGGEWWALHTKPRQEKSLARELLRGEFRFYLPVVTRRVQTRGRTLVSEIPLFDGYLFLHADRHGCLEAMGTKRVVRSLPVPAQDRLWSDLRRLARMIEHSGAVAPVPTLMPGQEVEIVDGPLAGLRGKVVRSASGQRFVVDVAFIGQGASVLCDGMTLRAVEETGPIRTAAPG